MCIVLEDVSSEIELGGVQCNNQEKQEHSNKSLVLFVMAPE